MKTDQYVLARPWLRISDGISVGLLANGDGSIGHGWETIKFGLTPKADQGVDTFKGNSRIDAGFLLIHCIKLPIFLIGMEKQIGPRDAFFFLN
jgi:hypothetical protein